MALVKKAFEAQDVADTSSDAQSNEMPSAAASPTSNAEAKSAASTAIVPTASRAVAPAGQKFTAALQHLEYSFSLDDVRSIGLAAPRLTIDTGGFTKDGKDLGKSVTLQLLSFNPRYIATAGVAGDEGKELVRFSYDGIHIDGESTLLNDYVNSLKADGYPRASLKTYTDLWGIIVDGAPEIQGMIGDTVVVQLSPQSGGQFRWFAINQGVKISRGMAQASDVIKIGVERVKYGTDNFGRATFAAA